MFKSVYEPLNIDPELKCYTDYTYVFNNSIIPCNMKIQNTGYSALIKPSTQYAIAFSSSKKEAININIGGTKFSTSNNLILINTSSLLTDDNIRISSKNIKIKDIRLLEKNKTDIIPNMFNGLKSSFEDKNNLIKINSINNNLLDLSKMPDKCNYSYDRLIYRSKHNNENQPHVYDISIDNNKLKFSLRRYSTYGVAFIIPTKPKQTYTISAKAKCLGGTIKDQVDFYNLCYRTSIKDINE
ncbi:hypothetical protein [Paraclostridium dentum]|uniref:hypothetical protein n=1 Tax=Paraclostridium dentum TaxID=2662455 RepID=UPI003F2AF310